MIKKLSLIALLVQSGLSFSAMAQESVEPVELSPEQIQHEETLTELRRQHELIEAKHAQAKLLKDCQDMGIDCGGDSLNSSSLMMNPPLPDEDIEEPFQMLPGSPPEGEQSPDMGAMPPMSDTPQLSSGGSNSGQPRLLAVQNSSAQLAMNNHEQWYVVGDQAGPWKVVYISATKVRLRNTQNQSLKTLLMTW